MKKVTIQIVPEGSGKVRTFPLPASFLKVLSFLAGLIALAVLAIVFYWADISTKLAKAEFYKQTNEKLIEKHHEYELAFKELDSIYSMESQLHNILETFLENDSHQVISLLDQNRFQHIPSQKTQLHFDYLYHPSRQDSLRQGNAPDILPVMGKVSQRYDEKKKHFGIDFAAAVGEPVYATQTGRVIFAGNEGALGLMVKLHHQDKFETRYGHLASIKVSKGEVIHKGEILGFVGMTGNTSGPHLHYEILKEDQNVNPELYFNHY
jgi:murein DD-endopeptidase MepM/ murein hydrolase activator NlpD